MTIWYMIIMTRDDDNDSKNFCLTKQKREWKKNNNLESKTVCVVLSHANQISRSGYMQDVYKRNLERKEKKNWLQFDRSTKKIV